MNTSGVSFWTHHNVYVSLGNYIPSLVFDIEACMSPWYMDFYHKYILGFYFKGGSYHMSLMGCPIYQPLWVFPAIIV